MMLHTGAVDFLQLCLTKNMCIKWNLCARQTHAVTYTQCWPELKRMDVLKCDYFKFNHSVMETAALSSSASSSPTYLLVSVCVFGALLSFCCYFRIHHTSPVDKWASSLTLAYSRFTFTSTQNLRWKLETCDLPALK